MSKSIVDFNPLSEIAEIVAITEQIAPEIYKIIQVLPENERWDTETKLRRHVIEMIANTAEAVGAIDPGDALRCIGLARSNISALQSLMKVGHKINLFVLNPETMVRLTKASNLIDSTIPPLISKITIWTNATSNRKIDEDKA